MRKVRDFWCPYPLRRRDIASYLLQVQLRAQPDAFSSRAGFRLLETQIPLSCQRIDQQTDVLHGDDCGLRRSAQLGSAVWHRCSWQGPKPGHGAGGRGPRGPTDVAPARWLRHEKLSDRRDIRRREERTSLHPNVAGLSSHESGNLFLFWSNNSIEISNVDSLSWTSTATELTWFGWYSRVLVVSPSLCSRLWT